MKFESYKISVSEFDNLYNGFPHNNSLFFNEIIKKLLNISPDKTCFFDIETTGLSADTSSLYLIGVLFYDRTNNQLQINQWFSEKKDDEIKILNDFLGFLKDYDTIIHYNGNRFDVPYIEKKLASCNLESPFPKMTNIDMYKLLKKKKSFFNLDNMKLTTVSKLLGYKRTDIYSGKDCIEIYSSFNQKRILNNPEYLSDYNKLLLHNYEDLLETYIIVPLLIFISKPFFSDYREEENSVVFEYKLALSVPFEKLNSFDFNDINFSPQCCYLGEKLQIVLPKSKTILKYFFTNYKDYYYLPDEDMAIHKSVGAYADKNHRQNAKASNCYIKKEGVFIPLPFSFHSIKDKSALTIDFFFEDYNTNPAYVLVNDIDDKSNEIAELVVCAFYTD